MLKKVLKISAIILVVFVAALFAIPYFFKDQIKAKIAEAIKNNKEAYPLTRIIVISATSYQNFIKKIMVEIVQSS